MVFGIPVIRIVMRTAEQNKIRKNKSSFALVYHFRKISTILDKASEIFRNENLFVIFFFVVEMISLIEYQCVHLH